MKRIMALMLAAMLVIGDIIPVYAQTLTETSESVEVTSQALQEETIPEETIPEEIIPEETIPEEIIPEETIPEETETETETIVTEAEEVPVPVMASASENTASELKFTVHPEDAYAGWHEYAEFTAEAEGGNGTLTYQWHFKRGITTYDYSWPCEVTQNRKPVLRIDADSYNGCSFQCRVTDENGKYIESSWVKLTICENVYVYQDPSDETVAEGDRVAFAVRAGGSIAGYQWQVQEPEGNWTDIPETEGISYSNTSDYEFDADFSQNGNKYRCKVTGVDGSEVFSDAAQLTVWKDLLFTEQPCDVRTEIGWRAEFSAKVTGGAGEYEFFWQYRTGTEDTWKNFLASDDIWMGSAYTDTLQGGTKSVLSICVYAACLNGYQFRCLAFDEGQEDAVSDVVSLTVANIVTIHAGEGGSVSNGSLAGIPTGMGIGVNENTLTFGGEAITAEAQEGYYFVRWEGIPGNGKITGDTEIEAVFAISRYTVKVTSQDGGSIQSGSGYAELKEIPYGTKVTSDGDQLTVGSTVITAAAGEMFEFTGWEGLPESGIVTGELQITAGFRRTTCRVHFEVGENGTVTGAALEDIDVPVGTSLYYYNGALRMYYQGTPEIAYRDWTAVPDEGYYGTWTGIPENEKVTENLTVTASFKKITVHVAVDADYDEDSHSYKGTVNGKTFESFNAEYGDQVIKDKEKLTVGNTVIIAEAKDGYVFDRWENVPEDGILKSEFRAKAVFRKSFVLVEVTAEEGGTVDVQDPLEIDLGTAITEEKLSVTTGYLNLGTVRVRASSKEGYHFDHFEGIPKDGKVTEALKVRAVFVRQQYDIRVRTGNGGSVTPSKVTATHGDTVKASGNVLYFGTKTVTAAAADGYRFTGWTGIPSDGLIKGRSEEQNITANFEKIAAKITKDPEDQVIYSGNTAVFTVAASGYGTLTYQWEYLYSAKQGWKKLSGSAAKTASYKVSSAYKGYSFRCTVTDSRGTVATSGAAKLTVVSKVSISKQPAAVTVPEGGIAEFTAKASGYEPVYQWQCTDAAGSWQNIAGANTLTCSFSAKYSQNGRSVRLQITDGLGSVSYSNAVKLTVYRSVRITSQPADQTVANGAAATFTAAAEGGYGTLSYQWQRRKPTSSSWSTISGAAARKASYKLTGSTSYSGYLYRCVVTDGKNNKVTSGEAVLTVYVKPSISSNPSKITVCESETAKFTVKANGTVTGYQWQVQAGKGAWQDISGATGNTYSFAADTGKNGYQYRCRVIGMYGSEAVSSAAALTVYRNVQITSQPANQSVRSGKTATFTVTAEGGYGTLSYQWQRRKPTSSSWSTISGAAARKASYKLTGSTSYSGYLYRCVVTDRKNNKAISGEAVLTVTR